MQTSEVINAKPACAKTLGNSSAFVKQRVNFRTSAKYGRNKDPRIYGKWMSTTIYVVYSYGTQWPIYVWDDEVQQWFGNNHKYSVSTTNHTKKASPGWNDVEWVSSSAIKEIIRDNGSVGHVRRRVLESARASA